MTNGSANPAVQQSLRAHSWVIFVFFFILGASGVRHFTKKKNQFLQTTNITMQD